MSFITYIRDRVSYIIVYLIGNALTITVMQLDRIRAGTPPEGENVFYSILLILIILFSFLCIDYMRKRGVFKILSAIEKGGDNLEQIFRASRATCREHGLFLNILIKNFKIYEEKLKTYKDRQKEQLYFINQWAHQMKTPVSVIKLILEDSRGGLDAGLAESITEEVEKLSRGLEMALYTVRLNDFEQDFKIEKIDVVSIVREIINEHKKEFIRYSIYPKLQYSSNMPVKSDAKWIRFVINQVISNSIKYSRYKEGEHKSLVISTEADNDNLILSIVDEGVGIPEEDIKRVFNPFFTGSNGRKFPESTGMGMYLSKKICGKLGHDISIESEEGLQTKVMIVFHKGRSIYS